MNVLKLMREQMKIKVILTPKTWAGGRMAEPDVQAVLRERTAAVESN